MQHLRSRSRRSAKFVRPSLVEQLESRCLLAAHMIADLNVYTNASSPDDAVVMNGVAYFTADDGVNGRELWRSDGTTAGTTRVTDFASESPDNLTVAGARLFFTTSSGLWVTNGTAAGTTQVSTVQANDLRAVVSNVFFNSTTATNGNELWFSDGTAAGTKILKDIYAGTTGSLPTPVVNLNGVAYFVATSAIEGRELWRSDGTAAGTTLVRDLITGSSSSSPEQLTVLGNAVYFVANSSVSDQELWRTDGTTTSLVKDINPWVDNNGQAQSSAIVNLTAVGNKLFFYAQTQTSNLSSSIVRGLWVSDGTAAGTQLVSTAGITSSGPYGQAIFDFSGLAVFSVIGPGPSGTLWRSDGTAGGTFALASDLTGAGMASATVAGGKIYLATAYQQFDTRIYYTDGTVAGTGTIAGVLDTQSHRRLVTVGGKVNFAGSIGDSNIEWTAINPTNNAVSLVKDINTLALTGSDPQFFRSGAGAVYFLTGSNTYTVWRTDGTAAGTTQIGTFGTSSAIGGLAGWDTAEQNGRFIFQIEGKIYSTDGTAAGTHQIANFGQSYYVSRLTRAGDKVFFAARSAPGAELTLYMIQNDTVSSVGPTAVSGFTSYVYDMIGIGNVVYYLGGGTDAELWRSDGTAAGTYRVADIFPGTTGSSARGFTNVNGVLYFIARNNADNKYRLFKSDGTEQGTTLVTGTPNLYVPGDGTGGNIAPGYLATVNGILYFLAASPDTPSNYELWRSDGTEAGTYQLKDVNGTTNTSAITTLTAADGRLFFVGNGELWTSDGTAAGTVQVSSGLSGDTNLDSSNNPLGPVNLAAVGKRVFFVASSAATGIELFSSDGTAAGTTVQADVRIPGNGLYNSIPWVRRPSELATLNGAVYFAGGDGLHGFEPWILDATLPTANTGGPYTVAEGGNVTLTGTASSVNGAITQYEWDFNYDGTFNVDAASAAPSFNAADGSATRTIAVRVTDSLGLKNMATGTVNIVNVAPTATFKGGAAVTLGAASAVSFTGQTDVAADMAGLRYSFDFNNDGDFLDAGDVLNSSVASASKVFATSGTKTVHGRISDKDGGYTDYTTTVTIKPLPPAMPTSPSATVDSSSQITFKWTDASSNETGFRIQRSTSSTFGTVNTFTVGANITQFVDTGRAANTTYYYRVQAYNGGGSSSYTTGVSTTTSTPAAPTSPSATVNSASQITVRWTDASSNETGFRIQRSTSSSFSTFTTFTVGANVTQFVDTGLAANTTYYYRVQAYNGVGSSSYATAVSAKTLSVGPITAPSGLSGTAGRTSMLLKWLDNSNNEAGFEIQYSTVYNFTAGTTFTVSVPTVNATSFTVTGLTPSTWYYFRVRAVNGTTVSSWSSSIKIKTLA